MNISSAGGKNKIKKKCVKEKRKILGGRQWKCATEGPASVAHTFWQVVEFILRVLFNKLLEKAVAK